MRKITVVHLVAGGLKGGAARGAFWLHEGLLEQGIDSRLVTNVHDDVSNPTVTALASSRIRKIISLIVSKADSFLLLFFPNREKRIFSTGLFGLSYKKTLAYKEADIVHLHWINGLVSINSIKKIDKPIVWSVRDMWPITGGCHYSLDCNKYIHGCGKCPQLNDKLGLDFTRLAVRKKRKIFKRIKPVGISDWVAEEINKSAVFGEGRASSINNNVDCNIFFPIASGVARSVLCFSTSKKIILIGSTDVKDFYKGFSFFLDALKNLEKENYLLCVFGKSDIQSLEATGFEYKSLGYLHDDVSMRLAYSAADVFVAPSIQEAFGKTLVESMACKTPVVCFDATGPGGIVTHKIDGYKAKPFDSVDLAKGIQWVLHESDYGELSEEARKTALMKFDSAVIAKKYIEVYENLIAKESE